MKVSCGLTAKKPGSALCPILVNDYRTTFYLSLLLQLASTTGTRTSLKRHLAVKSSGDNVLCVGRVGQTGHATKVTLLFQDMCLTLPLPNTQLTQFTARQSYPLRRPVYSHRRYWVHRRRLRYAVMDTYNKHSMAWRL